jgi:D-cysteine desulfhydrase/L-cysteate sulfo-lyase
LNKLFGASSSTFHIGEDEAAADANIADIAEAHRKKGKKPYLLTLSPTTKPLGALGYMRCAGEILDQLQYQKQPIEKIVVASGSAATHVGILLGLRLLGSEISVHGICVRRDKKQQTSRVKGIVRLAENLIGCGHIVLDSDIKCHDDWLAPGYGKMNGSVHEAMTLAGTLEGMIVDPVYTAKSLAGAIGLYRQGVFSNTQNILYLHTGGMPAIFAYENEITEKLNKGLSTKHPNYKP